MAKKILGQLACAATTDEDVYTVPAGKSAVVSTISICNTSSGAVTYRIAARKAGAAITTAHYIAYDVSLPGFATDTLTMGITLAETDVLTVRAGAGSALAVSVFGDES